MLIYVDCLLCFNNCEIDTFKARYHLSCVKPLINQPTNQPVDRKGICLTKTGQLSHNKCIKNIVK